jgi:catechol 2,3-dioxygenase-like lactoylglutathione lyase family enzyme
MAHGARIGSAVMFVQQLDRSVSFYTELLGMRVADQSPTAALLVSPAGTQLILRAMGANAGHPLGGVGLQYVVWSVAGKDDFERCERVLKAHSAHRQTRSSDGVLAMEGHDPDDSVVMITYPGPDEMPAHVLPARIYGW